MPTTSLILEREEIMSAEEKDADKKPVMTNVAADAVFVSKPVTTAAEVRKAVYAVAPDFAFDGKVGGRFTIRGKGFSSSGTVLIGGIQAFTNEWGSEYIGGRMPDGVKGKILVEVIIDSATRQSGSFAIG